MSDRTFAERLYDELMAEPPLVVVFWALPGHWYTRATLPWSDRVVYGLSAGLWLDLRQRYKVETGHHFHEDRGGIEVRHLYGGQKSLFLVQDDRVPGGMALHCADLPPPEEPPRPQTTEIRPEPVAQGTHDRRASVAHHGG